MNFNYTTQLPSGSANHLPDLFYVKIALCLETKLNLYEKDILIAMSTSSFLTLVLYTVSKIDNAVYFKLTFFGVDYHALNTILQGDGI